MVRIRISPEGGGRVYAGTFSNLGEFDGPRPQTIIRVKLTKIRTAEIDP